MFVHGFARRGGVWLVERLRAVGLPPQQRGGLWVARAFGCVKTKAKTPAGVSDKGLAADDRGELKGVTRLGRCRLRRMLIIACHIREGF